MGHFKIQLHKREVAVLHVGNQIAEHGEIVHIHDEGDGDSAKRVVMFGTHAAGDVPMEVAETKIWSPTRKVDRVEMLWVEALTPAA
jgi:hypothetical protein